MVFCPLPRKLTGTSGFRSANFSISGSETAAPIGGPPVRAKNLLIVKTYKTKCSAFKLIKTPSDIQKVKITCSKDAADFARQFFDGDIEIYESVFLILLNRVNNTVGWVKISQGGISGSVIDVKIVLKYVLDSLANGAILVHNHPSGSVQPSQADIKITTRVQNAMKLIDSSLFDHIVLSAETHLSLADEGLMEI